MPGFDQCECRNFGRVMNHCRPNLRPWNGSLGWPVESAEAEPRGCFPQLAHYCQACYLQPDCFEQIALVLLRLVLLRLVLLRLVLLRLVLLRLVVDYLTDSPPTVQLDSPKSGVEQGIPGSCATVIVQQSVQVLGWLDCLS